MTTGFANYPKVDATPKRVYNTSILSSYLARHTCIARGLGRSYGDSALSPHMLDCSQANHLLEFNAETGVLHAQAGVSLHDIIQTFLPKGFFPSVVPGTQFVSLGGAIASDIHGKNHHHRGTFSQSVLEITLLLGPNHVITCSSKNHADLFFATCGGMGLTGIILSAKIQLDKIHSSFIQQTTIKAENLKTLFSLFDEHENSTYSVAWLNGLATKKALGKGLIFLGEPAPGPLVTPIYKPLNIPFFAPKYLLNKLSINAFNTLYYQTQKTTQIKSFTDFFFPLDRLNNWNRLYGRQGFLQYQCGFSEENSFQGVRSILTTLKKFKLTPTLCVLKKMGAQNSSPLSFPFSGYSLALDVPLSNTTLKALNECDQVIKELSGRLYLAKDARMSASMFHDTYPNLLAFSKVRQKYNLQKQFQSLQSIRLEI